MHQTCELWTQLVTFSFTSYRSCYLCQIFLLHFLLHSRCSARDLRYLHWENLEFLLSICVTYEICEVVSLCSVDAAHMHRRDFDDQMWIYLWPRLMLLTYASHRAWDFSNPTPGLECAGHMPFLKFNPTPRIFSNPLPAAPRRKGMHIKGGLFSSKKFDDLIMKWYASVKNDHNLKIKNTTTNKSAKSFIQKKYPSLQHVMKNPNTKNILAHIASTYVHAPFSQIPLLFIFLPSWKYFLRSFLCYLWHQFKTLLTRFFILETTPAECVLQ